MATLTKTSKNNSRHESGEECLTRVISPSPLWASMLIWGSVTILGSAGRVVLGLCFLKAGCDHEVFHAGYMKGAGILT